MRERVREARVGRLATIGADGRPHLVPICFALEGDVLYSAVDEKPKRSKRLQRLENIRNRPDVAVLVDHYDEDWERLWWVRLDGTASVLEDGAEREHALALLRSKYEQYRLEPPTGAVIAVRVERWRGWSSAGLRWEVAGRPEGRPATERVPYSVLQSTHSSPTSAASSESGVASSCGGSVVTGLRPSFSRQKL